MLVGVAPLPPSFPPSGTFYIINRPNWVKICNTVYVILTCKLLKSFAIHFAYFQIVTFMNIYLPSNYVSLMQQLGYTLAI